MYCFTYYFLKVNLNPSDGLFLGGVGPDVLKRPDDVLGDFLRCGGNGEMGTLGLVSVLVSGVGQTEALTVGSGVGVTTLDRDGFGFRADVLEESDFLGSDTVAGFEGVFVLVREDISDLLHDLGVSLRVANYVGDISGNYGHDGEESYEGFHLVCQS
ncbi:unnamed protein product [Spodoptera littoralis]|uniref:Uncharacterized protein n=1 Tax=Spodoptera littoralis TaxID=7109 RepID=A0A9P0I0T8_SPOLI|nr:unnamed protein product [Spodoptera littoralis]CAH1638093.1 unnamed protein product [Spodoptera littoralis]